MMSTLTVLLYVGLSLCSRNPVVAEILQKPNIWADPGTLITLNSPVTIWCEGNQDTHMYVLSKERGLVSQNRQMQKDHMNRAKFIITSVTALDAGRYHCYSYNSAGWSEHSDTLELVVTGSLHKPTIWAEPGTLITSSSSVTIWCEGTRDTEMYVLHKDGSPEPLYRQTVKNHNTKTKFTISYVKKLDAGRYHCYSYNSAGWSERSDTLELVVTGVYQKPLLSALPNPVVNLGGSVTLSCISNQRYNRFILIKNGKFSRSLDSEYVYNGLSPAKFQVGPITLQERWSFTCYGYYTSNLHCWSEGSDTLELLVSGSVENVTEAKNMSKPKTASETQDHHTAENFLRMGMAALVFVVLGLLVFEACHSC